MDLPGEEGKREQKEVGLKTFDELYGEVCSELRAQGKSIDLCEKMKTVHSDLKRVQLLLQFYPRLLSAKLPQGIGPHFQPKANANATAKANAKERGDESWKNSVDLSRSLPHREAIQLLTRALKTCPCPWKIQHKSDDFSSANDDRNEKIIEAFRRSHKVDDECIEWLVQQITMPANSVNDSASAIQSENEEPIRKSLANIYFERCARLSGKGEYKLAILDAVRGIICCNWEDEEEEVDIPGLEKKKKVELTFRTVNAVATGLKAMSRIEEAALVWHEALQLLRLDQTLDNGLKSRETIRIVNILKDIKTTAHFSPVPDLVPAPDPGSPPLKPTPAVANGQTSHTEESAKVHEPANDVKSHIFSSAIKSPEQERVEQAERKRLEKKQRKQERRRRQQQQKHQEQEQDGLGPEPEPESEIEPESTCPGRGEKEMEVPHVFGNGHPTLIAASDVIDLKYDPSRGRHAVAKRTIPPGATLMVDRPYSWSLSPRHYDNLCQHCCRPCHTGIPCQNCAAVIFCGWDCWQAGWREYHKFECPIMKSLDSSEALGEMALLSFRTVLRTDLRQLIHLNRKERQQQTQSEDFSESKSMTNLKLGLNSEGKLDPSSFVSVFALTSNGAQRSAGEVVKRTLAAIYLTLCLRLTGFFQQFKSNSESKSKPDSSLQTKMKQQEQNNDIETEHDFDSDSEDKLAGDKLSLSGVELETAAFLLRLSQSLSCNAYGINSVASHSRDSLTHKLRIEQTIEFGGASYPTISMINHSCNPNVFRLTLGNKCIVRAVMEIQEGEEIFDSYGPLFTLEPRENRKLLLKSQYFFDCNCPACLENWPTFQELRTKFQENVGSVTMETKFKCINPKCGQVVTKLSGNAPKKKNNNASVSSSSCPHCGFKIDWKKTGQVLLDSERKYNAARDSLISTDILQGDDKNGPNSNLNPDARRGKIKLELEMKLKLDQLEKDVASHISLLQKFLTSPHRLIVESMETLKLVWNARLLLLQNQSQNHT